ncbi:MAG: isoleucine--tRNA ligase [Bacteroidales bacterium]
MSSKFREYKDFDLSKINREVLGLWDREKTFHRSISSREGHKPFVFYEGPPSANGIPGIHHVISRTIKDIFCRYKTLRGYRVERKAGWDTHGLPVELSVEKTLGITKEDIGKSISIDQFNKACRKEVMKYTDLWEDLTRKMGYWVDMDNPYITFDNRYVETLWYLLSELFKRGLLYKGYSIQPYSPAAGTGLSTHELNQPGCYKDVKDTTVVAQFRVERDEKSGFLFEDASAEVFFLAWTTTPWTLPSNTALAVGEEIDYSRILTFNPYTGKPVTVILATALVGSFFPEEGGSLPIENYRHGDKIIPWKFLGEHKGAQFEGIRYEQLFPLQQPAEGDAFVVLVGDFVTTDEGTGIVHVAPSFGADDFRIGQQYGVGSLTLVDRKGKFTGEAGWLAGKYVKNEYDESIPEGSETTDVEIAVHLKNENRAFKIEKYVHSYPHCWRTDKPVLYYPLDSWFIRTTALKERLIELNNTINWKPPSTGTGRFGKWLENLVDWNLSRSRYWGTPLPIWATEDGEEKVCIGSVAQLRDEIEKSVAAGFMEENPLGNFRADDFSDENYNLFDLHRPFVDEVVLVSESGKRMVREQDLIDVWFDSGAMPYAQMHYPFNNREWFENNFPADFIAEGVDQTRGWFFTLHAIAGMLFDSVAFKNIISNGLILDKNGNKMSKRLGNAANPFDIIERFGSDPLRWYLITNAQPWDNLRFDEAGVEEVRRKFFGTLYNTWSFFALYANVDGFTGREKEVPLNERPEIDRWIISLLNSLVRDVEQAYEDYEPTRAGRAIQEFVTEHLSNWYVRLNRKRYWGGEPSADKLAAYQTLFECLEKVALLASPIAPFYTDMLYRDLKGVAAEGEVTSVHLAKFCSFDGSATDKDLEERMELAQRISSMVLGLRRKVNIKVRQPLGKIMIPATGNTMMKQIEGVKNLILSETNIRELEFISDTSGILVKKIKPDFKKLGPRYGKLMKAISSRINSFTQEEISELEFAGSLDISVEGRTIPVQLDDVEIVSEDIPGWLVANEGNLTVALDITITGELKEEGIAREFINRIQNLRKESGFDVTDKIRISIRQHEALNKAVEKHKDYIGSQTLASGIELVEEISSNNAKKVEIDEGVETLIKIERLT